MSKATLPQQKDIDVALTKEEGNRGMKDDTKLAFFAGLAIGIMTGALLIALLVYWLFKV